MKILKVILQASLPITFLFVSPASATHGGMEGGGGKGVVCGSQLRVLDLYEIEVIHGDAVSKKYDDLDSNIAVFGSDISAYRSDSYINPADPSLRKSVLDFIKGEILPKFSDIPEGTHLPLTPDATVPPLPPDCHEVQIAVYANDGKIYRDRQLWDQLDIQNQAALILHEGIYHAAKLEGAKTSDHTRRIVGLAFAEKLPEPMLKAIWKYSPPRVWCGTDDSSVVGFELYAVNESQNGQKGVGIYFARFESFLPMERLSTFIPNMTTYDFFKRSGSLIQTVVKGSLFGDSSSFAFQPRYINGPWKNNYGIDISLDQLNTVRAFCEIR